jgi:hypothetical protein
MKTFDDGNGRVHLTKSDKNWRSLCGEGQALEVWSLGAQAVNCPYCLELVSATYKERDKFESHLRVFNNMMSDILNVARIPHRNDSRKHKNKAGSYEFIPHSTADNVGGFAELTRVLTQDKRWSGKLKKWPTLFLDAGCGIGNVMMTAQACGITHRQHGLELFDDTIEQARTFLGLTREHRNDSWSNTGGEYRVYKRDIMTFDRYNHYDVIYFYCPFCDSKMQAKLEEHIENSMKKGAVLIRRLSKKHTIQDDPRFERINLSYSYASNHVFIKVKK